MVQLVDEAFLQSWPLPTLDGDAEKRARGTVLVVGGSVRVPGAALLAGTAALRSGAGKLQIATTESTARALGVAMPEALVAGFPESDGGGIHPRSAGDVIEMATRADAVLIGPGMDDRSAIADLVGYVTKGLATDGPVVILDARAITTLDAATPPFPDLANRLVLTPNTVELAALLDEDPDSITEDRL